ncbi:unnamed protein product [Menidia menidia]|uniref:(Atlantic silverside) hypothetical protein n=1 Tax=Menidia menidia TaxID=238744 RepID=A0A8S4ADQ6_9TELE|nr:unnamed protein product [Menidia menidia]
MELLVRYLDRRSSISSVMMQDVVKEESLRDDLRYYFMSPCEKYRARRHLPWKMGVQILKIIMITTQLVLFGLNNQLVVAYKEENAMALKNLFLKDYSGVDEDDYCVAVYTKQAVYDSLFYVLDQVLNLESCRLAFRSLVLGFVEGHDLLFVLPQQAELKMEWIILSLLIEFGPRMFVKLFPAPSLFLASLDDANRFTRVLLRPQYSQLGQLSVGPISYAEDEFGKLQPLIICKQHYKRGSLKPSDEAFDIDAQLETVYKRLVDIKITFQLKGINLQTVRSRELPDCYSFYVTITFDNQCHSGKKNTHYLLVFDAFVILVCITSAALCTRSIVLAVRLLQRFSRYFDENFNRKVCEDDQKEFLNGWYVLVIVSDIMAIIGSILKMEIQAKSLTSYDVCSIFLGTSTLMVWVGVIRYLGYFQKYNVLILTMKAAFPKVLRFCCCAGMIYLGYTFCGWIVLGPYHEKFEGLSRVAECLFSLLNGDDMFTTFAQLKDKNILVWLFSRAYLYSFISLFIYMVLSLFIALITDSYETIKKYQRDGFPLTDLQKFLREQKDFPVIAENGRTVAELKHPALSCCQRVPANDDVILIS